MTRAYAAKPYCFISGFTHFSSPNTLLNAITRALEVKEVDEDSDLDSERGPPAGSIISLSEATKDALLVSQELEWTNDLVLLKWHGTFEEPDDEGDEGPEDDDDSGGKPKDPRIIKMRNDIVPSEVRVHFNLQPAKPFRLGEYIFVNDSTSSIPGPEHVKIRRYDEEQTMVINGSYVIAHMATNGRLTPYALYMLHFDLRGPGGYEEPYGWETTTQPPRTNNVQRNYYIKDQFTADLQCDDCIFEIDGLGLRSVDYGPMARAMKSAASLLSLPLPHSPYHHKVRTQRRKQCARKSGPTQAQKRFWRSIFGSSDLSEEEKVKEAWIGSGNLWCIRRPDRFPIEKTLASLPLPAFNVDSSRDLAGLEALPLVIFHLLTPYLSPKDFWSLLFLSKSLHASLILGIDRLVYASIRQTRPHLLPSTALKVAGHEERKSKEEEYWVSEWAKVGIHLGIDDERNWRSGEDVDKIPWMRYAREASRCPSMRNRRRIWGIALQLVELAERAGYI